MLSMSFRCAVTPTQIPSALQSFGTSDLNESHPRTILNPRRARLTLSSVPIRIAHFLLDTYLYRIILQYPILHRTAVEQSFEACFGDLNSQTGAGPRQDWDTFVISIILAISLSTAARNKQARAQSIGTLLYRNAMACCTSALTNDVRGLQALALLIQYTFLNPSVANLWLLTSLSSDACIDLGLHRELPASLIMSSVEHDTRRSLFWCVWEMEVAVCAGLQRPLRLLSKNIHIAMPSESQGSAISGSGMDTTASKSNFVAHRIWLFRKIESAVLEVLYQGEPLPNEHATIDSWMAEVDDNICEWSR